MPPPTAVALIDCNSFYVACEQLFNPALLGRPVVVLSNNDGCVISRSEEAKRAGVKMGVPLFQIKDLVARRNVAVLSSNYALYGDLSHRVMTCLDEFSPRVEQYSIDEAFLDLAHVPPAGLAAAGREIRRRVKKLVGIPISVGIAETKTLAKIAGHYAKHSAKAQGVLDLTRSPYQNVALERLGVADVWGVGPALVRRLARHGITTARALRDAEEAWARQQMGVVGVRLVKELNGVCCLPLEICPPPRRSVTVSRSFPTAVAALADVRAAVATFTTRVAEKLRRRQLAAGAVTVILAADRFASSAPYDGSFSVELAFPTDVTAELLAVTLRAAERLFRDGVAFKKAGVTCAELIPATNLQHRLWQQERLDRQRGLMSVIDQLNRRFGRDRVRFAAAGYNRGWHTRLALRSPRYTTCWDEVARVR